MDWVNVKWNSYGVVGDHCFRFAKELKLLKEDLKWWNRESFGNIDIRLENS